MDGLSQKEVLVFIGKRVKITFYVIPNDKRTVCEEHGIIKEGIPKNIKSGGEGFYQEEHQLVAITFRNDYGYDSCIQIRDIRGIELI